MVITKALILTQLIPWGAAGLLGVATTRWVVEHAGDNAGTAVVHVNEPGVEMVVGDQTFRIEDQLPEPLVCELPAGRHVLLMSRGDRVLYREVFTLGRGESFVLFPRRRPCRGGRSSTPCPRRPSPSRWSASRWRRRPMISALFSALNTKSISAILLVVGVGVTCFPRDGIDPEAVLAAADRPLPLPRGATTTSASPPRATIP